jgi:hypothetical protein
MTNYPLGPDGWKIAPNIVYEPEKKRKAKTDLISRASDGEDGSKKRGRKPKDPVI